MNPLSISRIHNEPTIYFANSLWIHYPFRENCMNLLSICRFTMNSLSISRIHHKLIVYFANSLGIYYLFFEFTLNQISISRTRYLSRENKMKTQSVSQFHWIDHEYTFYFANKLWKYFVFREFTNEFPFFFTNSLSISPIHYLFRQFTIYFATQLWIYSLFHELTIYFANTLWIHNLFCKFTINSLSISRI